MVLIFNQILYRFIPVCQLRAKKSLNWLKLWQNGLKSQAMGIPVKLATDSGANWPPVGAKRRWSFIITPCGWVESSLIYVFS